MIIIHVMNSYLKPLGRCAAGLVSQALARSPVVVLTGARQTGKTTLVTSLIGQERHFITLDDIEIRERAEKQPDSLLESSLPLTIDEVQRSPNLLLAIKRLVDRKRAPGRFLLTGSANLALLHRVSESLAGRAIYKNMLPMTQSEIRGEAGCGRWDDVIRNPSAFEGVSPANGWDWGEAVLRGGFPPAVLETVYEARRDWFDGYVKTYLERDLLMLSAIEHLADFRRLLRMAALRTGRLMNQSDLARDAGLSQATAHRYLSLLETSCLLYRLSAYAVNRTKRLIKAPRLFLCDTGLTCFLAGVHSKDDLNKHEMGGVLLENLVLNELLAWRETATPNPEILYWRTAGGREVDFIVECGGTLTPMEVKASAKPKLADIAGLNAFLDEYPKNTKHGLLIHTGPQTERLTARIWAIPLNRLLSV